MSRAWPSCGRRSGVLHGGGNGSVLSLPTTVDARSDGDVYALRDVPMNDSSTVPSFAVPGGARLALSEHVALQGGIDLRWHGNLGENEGPAGTGLERINDDTRRWAMPITAGVTYRF